jgi:carboxyl-terminal processing protease
MNLTAKERKDIFENVDRCVRKHHFDPGINGADWGALVQERRNRIIGSSATEEFESEMQALLAQLRTSHTGFFHRGVRQIPARHAINATLQAQISDGGRKWMFLDVHEGGAAHRAGIEPGDLLLRLSGKEVSPPIQPAFKLGEVVQMEFLKRDGLAAKSTLDIPSPRLREYPFIQPRTITVSHPDANTGLLKITNFLGVMGIDLARAIDRAMKEVGECNRLIIDLRGNTGGGIGGLRLMSYLMPDKVMVGYCLTRRRMEGGYDRQRLPRFGRVPALKIEMALLALRFGLGDRSLAIYTEGLSHRWYPGPIVLLVNRHTTGAAEMVAAFVKEYGRGRIIGTTTAGRFLPGSTFRVGHGYLLRLPVAAYRTWRDDVIEGRGVTPDVELELTIEALRAGQDPQMDRALELTEIDNKQPLYEYPGA